jgi:hypothetical protein
MSLSVAAVVEVFRLDQQHQTLVAVLAAIVRRS